MLPHSLRLGLRHAAAIPIKSAFASTWPMSVNASQPKTEWMGWPGGKQFAFVLSHDVEGRKGLSRCVPLAELEMRLGFRSTFFFVPEGEYQTPPTLRAFLNANGFEVGVHDLHHDG